MTGDFTKRFGSGELAIAIELRADEGLDLAKLFLLRADDGETPFEEIAGLPCGRAGSSISSIGGKFALPLGG